MQTINATDMRADDAAERPQGLIERALYKARRAAAYASFAFNQRVIGFKVPDRPDFDDATIPLFIDRVAKARNYLEFGSGASSVLAARQGVAFTSVETDRHYLSAVRAKMHALGLDNPAKQRFIHADIGLTEHWGAPLIKSINTKRAARWAAYPAAPWTPGAPKPDFVLVDGRFRVACALTAIFHLGQGDWELWLDDYLGRDHYAIVERFATLERMSGVTAIFRARPGADTRALSAAIKAASRDYR
jgi:hypothetical protein